MSGGKCSPSSEKRGAEAICTASATRPKPNFLIQSANASFQPKPSGSLAQALCSHIARSWCAALGVSELERIVRPPVDEQFESGGTLRASDSHDPAILLRELAKYI